MERTARNTEETKQEALPKIRAPSHGKRQSRPQRPLVTFQVFPRFFLKSGKFIVVKRKDSVHFATGSNKSLTVLNVFKFPPWPKQQFAVVRDLNIKSVYHPAGRALTSSWFVNSLWLSIKSSVRIFCPKHH